MYVLVSHLFRLHGFFDTKNGGESQPGRLTYYTWQVWQRPSRQGGL